ncbi:MAG: hypothetical protein ACJ797_07355 [Ktedonobacteraceae bacterium]
MAEATGHNEQDKQKPVIMLDIADGMMGHLLNEKGDSFKLHNLFGEDRKYLGGDAFTQAYFRTDSENIYHLDESGELVNGKVSESQKRIAATQLDPEALAKAEITVGEPFVYGKGGRTTRVSETVPTNERVYRPDYLSGLTQGKKTTIHSDFVKMMPPRTPQNK